MIGDHVYKGWNVRLMMGTKGVVKTPAGRIQFLGSCQWAASRPGFKTVYAVHLEAVYHKVDKKNLKMQRGTSKRCQLW